MKYWHKLRHWLLCSPINEHSTYLGLKARQIARAWHYGLGHTWFIYQVTHRYRTCVVCGATQLFDATVGTRGEWRSIPVSPIRVRDHQVEVPRG